MKLAWSGRLALVAMVAGAAVGVLPPAAAAQATSIDDREIDPVQPDFVVVNLPTNLRIPRHSFAFYLTHRFSRPLGEGDFSDLVSDFFGFDSGAKVGFGLRFGLFTATELSAYRTNDRAIQFGLKRDLLQQGEKPLSLGLQGAIEGRDNFSEIYSPALSLIASRKLGQRATLYAVPAYVGNVSANDADTGDDAFLLGLGGRLLVGHGVALLAEWTGHFGYDPPDPIDPRRQAAQAFTFGLEKRVGGHAFQLNFSNNFGSTYTSLARGGSQNDWFIGFNLSRKFY